MARRRRLGSGIRVARLGLVGTIIGALAVVIAALITGYFTLLANRSPSPSPTPTPTIQKTSTPLTALTPQQIYNMLPHLTPIVNDPLMSQDAQNWSTFDSGSVSCNFIDGTYHAIAQQVYPVALCFAQELTFSNFAIQVNMEVIKGLAGGLILRSTGTSPNSIMYRVRVGSDGTYDFFVQDYEHNHTGNLDPCPDPTDLNSASPIRNSEKPTAFIQTGDQVNVLTVIAVGDEITLFINSHEIGTICDKSSTSGIIGLIAAAYKGTTEVVYGNLKVWELK